MRGCRAYTTEEYAKLLETAYPRERCLIALGVRTGFRISELLSLNVEDVQGDAVYLKKSNTKGKVEGRKVPIHPEAMHAVRLYIDDRRLGPLFLNYQGTRLGRISAWEALRNTHTRASIREEGLATHSMRKTFAKNLYAALGGDLVKLQHAMGHKSIDSTSKYIGVNTDEIWNAIRNVK